MKLLIAPWGDPKNWRHAKYKINDKEYISKTSFIPIYLHEDVDKGIIFILDTLAESYTCIYDEHCIKLNIECFLKECIKEMKEKYGLNKKINYELVLCPGIGKWNRYEYRGTIYHYMLQVLLSIIREVRDNKCRIIVDLTHGINYMPTALLIVVSFLKKINKDIELRIYNSQPYPLNVKEIPTLNIERLGLELESSDIIIKGWQRFKDNVIDWNLISKDVLEVFEILYLTINYGLQSMLLLLKNYNWNNIMQEVEQYLFERKIDRKIFDEKIEYKFKDILLTDINIDTIFNLTIIMYYVYYYLNKLKNIIDNIIRNNSISDRDVEEFINILKDKILKEKIRFEYEEVKRKQSRSLTEITEREMRNYVAHQGFDLNIIEQGKDDRIILKKDAVSYLNKLKEKLIREWLGNTIMI